MKKDIHPEYREVAFVDLSINKTFIIRSAVQTKETVEIDGVTYPLYKLDTSSESHPFYTGAQTRIVEAGRVENSAPSLLLRSRLSTLLPKLPRPSNTGCIFPTDGKLILFFPYHRLKDSFRPRRTVLFLVL